MYILDFFTKCLQDNLKIIMKSRAWWYMPVILAFSRQRIRSFKVTIGYTDSLRLAWYRQNAVSKNKTKNKGKQEKRKPGIAVCKTYKIFIVVFISTGRLNFSIVFDQTIKSVSNVCNN